MRICIPPIALICLACAVLATTARAQFHVTTGGGSAPRDGSDWDHALSVDDFRGILGSVSLHDFPEGGGEFWVAAGAYPGIVPHQGTVILGGFEGVEQQASERDPTKNITILSHVALAPYRRQQPDLTYEFHYADQNTIIDGCWLTDVAIVNGVPLDPLNSAPPTIQNCQILSGSTVGGIQISDAGIKLFQCDIYSNVGDGVVATGTNAFARIYHCKIHDNTEGGLLVMGGARLELSDSMIINNGFGYDSPDIAFIGSKGSGIVTKSASEVVIQRCDISHNFGPGGAGGYFFIDKHTDQQHVLVENCTFTHNGDAEGQTGFPPPAQIGGGIWCDAEQPTGPDEIVFNDCTISDNVAEGLLGATPATYFEGEGGGVAIYGEGVTLNRCVIARNIARLPGNELRGVGGGIYINGVDDSGFFYTGVHASIRDCLIDHNLASGRGGGILLERADPFVVNCTVVGNAAGLGQGDAIYSDGATFQGVNDPPPAGDQSVAFFANCALLLNGGANGGETLHHFAGPTGGDPFSPPNFDKCAYDGIFIEDVSLVNPPQTFIPVGSNLPVQNPGFVDPVNGDYHLAIGSPLRDAGDNNYVRLNETDLDNTPRIAGPMVDIGAYEAANVPAAAQIIVITATAQQAKVGSTTVVQLKVTLQNSGIAPAANFHVTNLSPKDANGTPYSVLNWKAAIDPSGMVLIGEQVDVTATLSVLGTTGCVVDVTASGTYNDPGGAPRTFTDSAGPNLVTLPSLGTVTAMPASLPKAKSKTPALSQVKLSYNASDSCSALTTMISVTSATPIQPGIDWKVIDAHTVLLNTTLGKNEKSRTYNVSITVENTFGASDQQTAQVTVGKKKKKGH